MTAALPPVVRALFDSWPQTQAAVLEHLRRLILGQAARLPEIGSGTETLRWGQSAFLTPDTGAACALGLGLAQQDFDVFVQCRTGLIETFPAGLGAAQRDNGNRPVLFRTKAEIDKAALRFPIPRALTYHLPV